MSFDLLSCFSLPLKAVIYEKAKRGTMRIKQSEKKEIGRVKLSDNQELIATLIDNEKVDLRVFVDSKSYTGWTRNGLRFYLFDDNWPKFRKLMNKVDKVYEELA